MDNVVNPSRLLRSDDAAVGWAISKGLTDYADALDAMRAHATAIAAGEAGELVWLLEHPPLYTAGVSAKDEDLLQPDLLPVVRTTRGGQYTYHGPGQRVAYVMLDLGSRGRDVRCFVRGLEAWIIGALSTLGVVGEVRPGRVGVWVRAPGPEAREDKIAAIGVRVSRWVSFHGVSLNVEPDLGHYAGIVPCGISEHGVTSLRALGLVADMPSVDAALRTSFEAIFGPTTAAGAPI